MAALRRTLLALSVIPIVAGSATVLLGGGSVPASGTPTASIESELRFYSVWWIGAGLFIIWIANRLGERGRELRVFCGLLFLAGVSRIIAIVDAGRPESSQLFLMGVELTLPLVLVAWHHVATSRSEKAA